mgnify:CR=1 FL=1
MKNDDLEKIVRMLFSSILCISLFMQITVMAFDGGSHEHITEKSLVLFSQIEKNNKNFYSEDAKKIIMEHCTKPDIDENDGLFKDHFYNIATERNFMGEKISALVKFRSHYKAALINYKRNKMKKCWEELGRAIHFLEDINTPVHGGYDCPSDAMRYLSMHVGFEKTCIMVQNEYLAEINADELDYFLDNSLDDIGKMCARVSNDNFFALKKGYISEEEMARHVIITAQRIVVGILYRFSMEV